MRILAIETATPLGSVALLEGEMVVREVAERVPQRHLEWLAPAIAGLLDAAGWRPGDVQGLAVSRGPGSFTGLRIGVATAAAWAHTRGVPVIGLSTLEVVAAGARGSGSGGVICPVLDARRGAIAFALFERNETMIRLLDDTIGLGHALFERLPGAVPVTFAGDGVPRVLDAIRALPHAVVAPEDAWDPRAAVLGRIAHGRLARGERDDPYLLHPVYARGAGITPSRWTRAADGGEGTAR